ncbi:MAG: Gfo/Idh/MocA family oxidoreductase [bacterium]|nr:Gfo/Idh/MocA family oxidoreductase [bacterium]
MLKVGVIGAGSMGRHHVRVYSELETCELIGVADPDKAKSDLAEQYGAPFFTDHHALLELRPDLITIAAPTQQHYRLASDAIDAGAHLLVEKPITDNLDHAADLIARAKAAGKTIAVGHIERFNPAVTALKTLIDSGGLGDVLNVNALRVGPYHGRILDTGIVLDLGTHDVDLSSYLLGSRAERVFGSAIQRQHNHEDHAVLQLQFPGSKTAVIETSWLAPYRSRNVFVFGTKHFALCDLMAQQVFVYNDNPDGGRLLVEQHTVENAEPLRREITDVVNAALNGTAPSSTAEDSVYALRVCLAA